MTPLEWFLLSSALGAIIDLEQERKKREREELRRELNDALTAVVKAQENFERDLFVLLQSQGFAAPYAAEASSEISDNFVNDDDAYGEPTWRRWSDYDVPERPLRSLRTARQLHAAQSLNAFFSSYDLDPSWTALVVRDLVEGVTYRDRYPYWLVASPWGEAAAEYVSRLESRGVPHEVARARAHSYAHEELVALNESGLLDDTDYGDLGRNQPQLSSVVSSTGHPSWTAFL